MRIISLLVTCCWILISQLRYGNALPVKKQLPAWGSDYKEIMPNQKEDAANESALTPTLPGNILPIQTQPLKSDSVKIKPDQEKSQAKETEPAPVLESANDSNNDAAVPEVRSRNSPAVVNSFKNIAGTTDSDFSQRNPQKPNDGSSSRPLVRTSEPPSTKRLQGPSEDSSSNMDEMFKSSSAKPQESNKSPQLSSATEPTRKMADVFISSSANPQQSSKAVPPQFPITAEPTRKIVYVFVSSSAKPKKLLKASPSRKKTSAFERPSAKQLRQASNTSPTVPSFPPENQSDRAELPAKPHKGDTDNLTRKPATSSAPASPPVKPAAILLSTQGRSYLANGSHPGSDAGSPEVYNPQPLPPVNRSTLTAAKAARNGSASALDDAEVTKHNQSAGMWVVFGILMLLSTVFVVLTVCKRRIKKLHERQLNEPLDDLSEPSIQFARLRAQESRASQDGAPS